MKCVPILVVLVLTVTVVSCGGAADTSTVSSPKPGEYISSEQEGAYRTAKEACAGLGIKAIEETYGGGGSAIGAASAYASQVFSNTSASAATEGCLAGFGE